MRLPWEMNTVRAECRWHLGTKITVPYRKPASILARVPGKGTIVLDIGARELDFAV